MGVEGDRVDLSPSELQALAQMEAMASATDPTLDARLRTLRRFRVPRRVPLGYAVVGVIAGLAIVLLTIAVSFWLAALGVAVIGMSLYWTVEDVLARVAHKRSGPGKPPAG
jgi:Protein of unknown function (DUF3040)